MAHPIPPEDLRDAHRTWWYRHKALRPDNDDSCPLCRSWERRLRRNLLRDHGAIYRRRQGRAVQAGFESYHHQRRAKMLLGPGATAEEYEFIQEAGIA